MVVPTPLRPSSLHEEVATRLRSMVFERELLPGEWIDELALARDWQISRTPLREALKVLAAEGLVDAGAAPGLPGHRDVGGRCRRAVPGDGAAGGPLRLRGGAQGHAGRRAPAAPPARAARAPCRGRRHRRLLPRQPRLPQPGCRRSPPTAGSTAPPTSCAASCACCAAASSTAPGRIDDVDQRTPRAGRRHRAAAMPRAPSG